MQLSDRTLARRYAAALYQSAAALQKAEAVGAELAAAAGALSGSMAAFRHPRTSTVEKKTALVAELGKTVSPLTLRYLELLIEKKRFALLPAMAQYYQRISDEGSGIVHAAVRTARPLSELESKLLADRLGSFLGKRVTLDVMEAPELMAGVSVRVGDWVLDGSLKGKLRALSARLTGT